MSEMIVDFIRCRLRSDDFHVEVRFAFGVWADKILNDCRAFDVHDVSATMFAIELHATTPQRQTRIGNSDGHSA